MMSKVKQQVVAPTASNCFPLDDHSDYSLKPVQANVKGNALDPNIGLATPIIGNATNPIIGFIISQD